MSMNEKLAREAVELDLDELFQLLGSELSSSRGAFDKGDSTRALSARDWLTARRSQLASVVCTDGIRNVWRQPGDRVQLCLALSDLIAAFCTGVSPFVVAAIIMKIGVGKLCGWDVLTPETETRPNAGPNGS